jgi:MFS family permease
VRDPTIERPVRSARAIVAAVVVNGLGLFPVWLLGAMAADVQRELAFGAAALGAAVASFQAIAALCSVPAGLFAERVGPRLASLGTIGLFVVAAGGIALAADTWVMLVVWLSFAAVASSLSGPATNLSLAKLVAPARQGVAFGIKQASSPAATMLAGLAVPVVALTIGWRWAFGLAALAAIPLALTIPRGDAPVHGTRVRLRAKPELLRPLALLAIGGGLGTAATSSVSAFLVVSAIANGIAAGTAGMTLAAGGAISVVVRVIVGWQADRRGGRHFVAVAVMMALGAVGTAAIAVATAPLTLLAATLLAYGLGWGWNGLFDFAVVRQMPDNPASATGVTRTGKYVGGVVGPLTFGLTVEAVGYPPAWIGTGIAMGIAAGIVIVGRGRLRRALGR